MQEVTKKMIQEWAKGADQFDLRDVRRMMDGEIAHYDDRLKVEVHRIFTAFEGSEYFYTKEKALKELNKMLEWEAFFEQSITVDKVKISVEEARKLCLDYPKTEIENGPGTSPASEAVSM